MKSEVYKIQRSDGLFSNGGYRPTFGKNGKVWKRMGDLTQHLNAVMHNRITAYSNNVYGQCEIVRCFLEVTSIEVERTPISQHLNELENKAREEQEVSQRNADERQKKERQKQYEALKQEFEPKPLYDGDGRPLPHTRP